ncbi:MAG: arginase [Candidatus Limnocylindria bacterium]
MKAVEIVGVPMDLGGNRRGVDMGPSAVRYAGLVDRLVALGFTVADRGNLRVADPAEGLRIAQMRRFDAARDYPARRRGAHFAEEIVRVAEELARAVEEIERSGAIPLILGGDHSIAMGTLAGVCRAGRRPGVVYLDAHGDINTPESSPSGNVHGMPLAVALGIAGEPFPEALRGSIDGRATALVAIRDLDPAERQHIADTNITAVTMADIDRAGMAAAMERAIAAAGSGDGIHLSLDMDALDPDEAPGVGTPVKGGLTYREAQLAMEMLAASGQLRSIELAEVNPILDTANRTAMLGVELVASALGQTIL